MPKVRKLGTKIRINTDRIEVTEGEEGQCGFRFVKPSTSNKTSPAATRRLERIMGQ
jgi:hypothetical protein